MVRLGGPSSSGGGGGGGDSFNGGDGDKHEKKGRPSTPVSIAEVGDSGSAEEATPVIISTIFISRFQQEVGDPPGELVITPIATPIGSTMEDRSRDEEDEAVFAPHSNAEPVSVDGPDSSHLGAAAASPPPSAPPHRLRRQPTPDEAARYAEVARQLNEVARQIEADYSNELDQLVDSLNLVSEVAYDAFAAVAQTIIAKGITFSRILVLILFGWRVLKKVYSTGILGIVQRILEYILKFITDNVLAWVCEQGGWMNLLRNPPSTPTDAATSQGFPLPTPSDVLSQITPGQAMGAAVAFGACAIAAYLLFGNRTR